MLAGHIAFVNETKNLLTETNAYFEFLQLDRTKYSFVSGLKTDLDF